MNRLTQVTVETTENVDINLSPLIDMVFLLLIFFMVTTVFVEETGVDVSKPRAASARTLERNSILLAVSPGGDVVYGGRNIGLNGVRGLVSRLLKTREMPVILVADESVPTGLLVEVIGECKLGGAGRVSIAAERE